MSIEQRFDISLIASLASKEKQIQQNYRPIIAVHKWFARRPGTLFRGLLLSEFLDQRLDETYFGGHDLAGKLVVDPFMGGGTPLIEANRVGCDVLGLDINPMAAWIVREEIAHIDHEAYQSAASRLVATLSREVGKLYQTDCPAFGDLALPVKYFLWVKTIDCEGCGHDVDLFPRYLLADDTRHPRNVLVCSSCGDLNEVEQLSRPGFCVSCRRELLVNGPAKRNLCACPNCGVETRFPRRNRGPLARRLFAIEYSNPGRRTERRGRFFKKPDAKDFALAEVARQRLGALELRFAPELRIPAGDETDRLHRWGYRYYRELFNDRQLLGLELSCRLIAEVKNTRVRHALATNLSDLLRYQNTLCRYDTTALKSLDIFSVHGFPVGLIECESNILGIRNGAGVNVGSGGWSNIIDKYAKAKLYCDEPFEVQHRAGRKVTVPIAGEWIGEARPGARPRSVDIRCVSSTEISLAPGTVDAVLTDPPYFGNVQYAELMDFCFAWLRGLVGKEAEGFDRVSTRAVDELTGNVTEGRDLAHFTAGMAKVFQEMARALKPGAPLAFTYHHNRLEAYHAVGVAILDAGLTCSATLPCPAEMGGSIHIFGTGSSIIDTVFVCRTNGRAKRRHIFSTSDELTRIVRDELGQLRLAGVKPTLGDIRCIVFGHLTRMAIWQLRAGWDESVPTSDKLARFAQTLSTLGRHQVVIDNLIAVADGPANPPTAASMPPRKERSAVSSEFDSVATPKRRPAPGTVSDLTSKGADMLTARFQSSR
jgi:adenine-specific DNA methylase